MERATGRTDPHISYTGVDVNILFLIISNSVSCDYDTVGIEHLFPGSWIEGISLPVFAHLP